MKIAGHPLHVMLIHFPSALLPMNLVCSLLYCTTGKVSFTDASFYAGCGGVLLGWAAVVSGCFDLLAVFEQKQELVKKVLWHGGINSLVILAYTIIVYAAWKRYPLLVPDSTGILFAKGTVIALMFAGNFAGGNLVIKERIAVKE
jgi:uncharacterized membrane protein